MNTAVTLFSQDDIHLMFQVGVAIEFAAIAMFFAASLNAMRRARVRVPVRRPRR